LSTVQAVCVGVITIDTVALVDKYRRVRGIYDGLKEDEIQKLMVDIKGLMKETVAPKRFMTGFSNNPN
jgi:hypothetical protein